ncbi:MAG: hypothetical protein JW996_04090 [Candidatus Cloacimonetes bacterium]|nr:hypothetical protein [Candidatus Cloacimonadota bacterium]
MYMILNLFKEKYLDDILMAMTEAGIEDTIVLSGESLGHKLIFDNPIFAGFRTSYSNQKGYTRVIMAVAESDQVDFMLEELANSGMNFKKDEIGQIILLPISKIY